MKSAVAEKRDYPSEPSEFGLLNIRSRISFEMSLEEKERFATAMGIIAQQMGGNGQLKDRGSKGLPPELDKIMLFLSQKILDGEMPGNDANEQTHDKGNKQSDNESADSAISVSYQQCTDCAGSSVHTVDGKVQIDPQDIDRIVDSAKVTVIEAKDLEDPEPLADGEIDPPNSATLARKVHSVNGNKCANPGCGSKHALQAHHIRFLSKGGRTAISNEVSICRTCHTLVHAGLLTVTKSTTGALNWVPQIRERDSWKNFDPFKNNKTTTLTDYQAPPHDFKSRETTPTTQRDATLAKHGINLKILAEGLITLGYNKKEARARIQTAAEKLCVAPHVPSEENILGEALCG